MHVLTKTILNHLTLRADVSPSLAWLLALTKSLASLLSRIFIRPVVNANAIHERTLVLAR